MSSVVEAYSAISKHVMESAQIAGRSIDDIRIVAVSKKVQCEKILELYRGGHSLFGENYIQEMLKKQEWLEQRGVRNIDFHFIGRLQRNKVRAVVGRCSLIHSVDRIELAEEIDRVASAKGTKQAILLQVNISQADTKAGVLPVDCARLLERCMRLSAIEVKGLMSIGSIEEEKAVGEFLQLSAIRSDLESQFALSLPELSMGMSSDYPEAIKHGATLIRLGTAIFGPR